MLGKCPGLAHPAPRLNALSLPGKMQLKISLSHRMYHNRLLKWCVVGKVFSDENIVEFGLGAVVYFLTA